MSSKANFIQALSAKSLETIRLTESLSIAPEDLQARLVLGEHLAELAESSSELGFVHLEAAIVEALERLEREAFGPPALVALRVLAWRYESLAAMPGESGTHPVVSEDEVPQASAKPAAAEGETAEGDAADEQSLRGRRILVADDEAEVRWFYVGVLREASARVIEAGDGVHALDLAREQVPDVILADIVMPRLDGLGLCAAIRREPQLDGVPVILLSWQDDFLHRMRELRAEAQGYLRKEVPAREILGRVSRVLAPLLAVEGLLEADGEVSGDLEEIGIPRLLRTVRRFRPNSSIVLQDPWSLFDLELHEGQLSAATRTAVDGAVTHGEGALPALVGMSSGRFVVAETIDRAPQGVPRSLEPQLADATRRLGTILNSMAARPDCRVEFDAELLSTYVRHSPVRVRQLISGLAKGEPPQALWESGAASRTLVDALLVTLARQGAIREVRLGDRVSDQASEEPPPADSAPGLNPSENQQESSPVTDAVERENERAQSAVAMYREPANRVSARFDPIWRLGAGIRPGRSNEGSGFETQMQTTPRLIGLGFAVLLSMTVAFLIWKQFTGPAAPDASSSESATAEMMKAAEPLAAEHGGQDSPRTTPSEGTAPSFNSGQLSYSGTLRSGVDVSLVVAEDQGVLEISGPSALRVVVDGSERGNLPLQLVLGQGTHRVAYFDGVRSIDRFYYVKPGATRTIQAVTQAGGLVDPR